MNRPRDWLIVGRIKPPRDVLQVVTGTGKAKGGYARARVLTKEQRSAQASHAARVRWAAHKRRPHAPTS